MSVAEFFLACIASVPLLIAGHECARLYAIKQAAEVFLHSNLSHASLSVLDHIKQMSFTTEGKSENPFERRLERDLEKVLDHPLFQWRWFNSQNESLAPLVSMRISATGPTYIAPTKDIHISINLCVPSWLEPLMQVVNDGRSCLGEFTKTGKSRGITLHLEGNRENPVHVPIYFFGLYTDEIR